MVSQLPKFRKMSVRTLIPMINGLFTYINYSFPEFLNITSAELDILFVSNWGMRTVAPVVCNLHTSDSSELTPSELTTLGDIINHMFSPKWDKQSALLSLEYDPIHNYSDTYHESTTIEGSSDSTLTLNTLDSDSSSVTIDRSITDSGSERTLTSDSINEADGGTESRTGTTSKSISGELTTDTDSSVTVTSSDTKTGESSVSRSLSSQDNKWGFNSGEDSVPTDSAETTETTTSESSDTDALSSTTETTGSNTETRSDTEQGSSSETIRGGLTHSTTGSKESTVFGGLVHTTDEDHTTSGSKSRTGTEGTEVTSEQSRLRDFTHVGNIGNLTTQQLITQEIELWRWNFIQEVLNDVKDFLTLPVYD